MPLAAQRRLAIVPARGVELFLTHCESLMSVAANDWPAKLSNAHSVGDLVAQVARYNGGLDPAALTDVAIIGAAQEGERLVGICRSRGISIAALVDDDPTKLGTLVEGAKVEPGSRLQELD